MNKYHSTPCASLNLKNVTSCTLLQAAEVNFRTSDLVPVTLRIEGHVTFRERHGGIKINYEISLLARFQKLGHLDIKSNASKDVSKKRL
jgi:hypothetical protein